MGFSSAFYLAALLLLSKPVDSCTCLCVITHSCMMSDLGICASLCLSLTAVCVGSAQPACSPSSPPLTPTWSLHSVHSQPSSPAPVQGNADHSPLLSGLGDEGRDCCSVPHKQSGSSVNAWHSHFLFSVIVGMLLCGFCFLASLLSTPCTFGHRSVSETPTLVCGFYDYWL